MYKLVGIKGNSFIVMEYVKLAMRDAAREASRIGDVEAEKIFGPKAQQRYISEAMRSEWEDLLLLSQEQIDLVNSFFVKQEEL